ncbi:glycoside hydrolase family 3 N-terminal domain-containing protein [Paenibacillus sp. JDR-2]|uniref:glycoside hydrolase family 3 N-terminal domain-containing protein n=1 Tax=Paenibacillus sp. (strain JDR-2) TaxID=324057 RepID=UPI00016666AC|nr:glycoside hydrolase family 3 N-terminal domain-containing protein [Paenibacillus sp. JDR-2]ACT02262.1 glycoside hydrolase family 3 domain protein [Paenibacillus sp. JDR-2]
MIGLWHAFVETPRLKLKLQFKIAKKANYTLDIAMEPIPLPIRMETVEAGEGSLRGTGYAFWKPDEQVKVELAFEEAAFTGSLYIPLFGSFALQGEKGRGPFLSEALAETVKPYRKGKVAGRTDEEMAAAVELLLGKLSLEDKIGQMCQCMASNFSFGGTVKSDPPEKLIAEGRAGSVLGAFDVNRVFELQKIAVEQSPHKIPLFFNGDIIHGAQTIFPVPLAWSCSWDTEAIREACAISAKEASASGIMYNHGPMIDISREPRWGRVVEGAGEDPYLGSLIAKAQVEGYQGHSLQDEETIIACLKHFVGYGAAEGGRDYNTVDFSEGTLRNLYLPPFRAGIEAGAGSVMNAFNIYQGIPVAASSHLLKELLRDELGFEGILISDYGAVDEIVEHGYAKDAKEAAMHTVNATMDIEMVTRSFDYIPELIREGKLSESQLDEAVRRILILKYKTGLMDDPFRYIRPEQEIACHFSEAHLQASRELARKSIVLLKNDGVLPLAKETGKIALIGPFADSKDLLGPWQFSRYGHETVTLYEGLREKGILEENLLFAAGSGVNAPLEGGIKAAVEQADQADLVILALGESSDMSGEAASRMSLELPEAQLRLADAVIGTGKPVVLVLTNGRPLVLTGFEDRVNAILETWFLGSQAGHAIADVLAGDYNPTGRLTMSFPVHTGQVPVYYNHFRTGRPLTEANAAEKFISKYLDGPNEPLYPFGYGLSYTRFEYGEVALDRNEMKLGESLRASVAVANAGNRAGEETVQLYIQDVYGSVVRPIKELKRFAKVSLEAGETREIVFEIDCSDLAFWSPNNGYKAEPGEFRIMIGPNSRDVRTARMELIEP